MENVQGVREYSETTNIAQIVDDTFFKPIKNLGVFTFGVAEQTCLDVLDIPRGGIETIKEIVNSDFVGNFGREIYLCGLKTTAILARNSVINSSINNQIYETEQKMAYSTSGDVGMQLGLCAVIGSVSAPILVGAMKYLPIILTAIEREICS